MNVNDNSLDGQLQLLKNLDKLPKELEITTISFTFDLPIKFMVENISEYIELSLGGISTIKYMMNGQTNIRTLHPEKYITKLDKKSKKRDKKVIDIIKKDETMNGPSNKHIKKIKNTSANRKNFGDQVTIIMDKHHTNDYSNDTNIKIFSNGAIQFSGCLGFSHFNKSISLLFKEIVKDKYYWNGTEFIKIIFCDSKLIQLKDIKNFKINLVNTGFNLGFSIHRDNLFELLLEKKVNCSYEPSFYPGIQIIYEYKYKNFRKDISIVIFEKGYVMINGGIYVCQIIGAYKFINDIIHNNYRRIIQWSLDDFIKIKTIKKPKTKKTLFN